MTKKIIITGVVQGVGFRPFIYNIANSLHLKGNVSNTSEGVIIYVNIDNESKLKKFIDEIRGKKPPNSKIDEIKIEDYKDLKFDKFEIITSSITFKNTAKIPADLAICKDCIDDISNPLNKRYLYPFTNCTNCGPRFTITEKIPYDRKNTSMKHFKMCKSCNEEYHNPSDRRFHAQPNACNICGPEVWVIFKNKKIIGIDAIDFIAERIIKGDVVVIKGLGGFHMACDAFNKGSVKKIRMIKKREFKPLAIMVEDFYDIEEFVYIDNSEIDILKSSVAPIVMLRKKDKRVFEYVAPGLDCVGVMIAYTPLHKILFLRLKSKGFKNPLVMTSGNFKDEPIIKDNDEAYKSFKELSILYHNRDIVNRIDDSVGFIDINKTFRVIRRARGYVPDTIRISKSSSKEMFAVGGDLKNSFAFLRGCDVFMSQYIGDLDNINNINYYKDTFINIKKLYGFKPEVMILDMHPLYRSSQIALEFGIKKRIYVQHHVAHIYSVMAEYGFDNDVIGVSFDGTGYGIDGKIWGGEVFVVKNEKIFRAAKIEDFFIIGGDSSVKDIWKSFISIFCGKNEFIKKVLKGKVKKNHIEIVDSSIKKKINGIYTSSCGRLFDAISVIVSGRVKADFEAEGPMRMESLIRYDINDYYKFKIEKSDGKYIMRFSNFLDDIILDYYNLNDNIATKFHNSIINLIFDIVVLLSKEYSIKRVVLSGGVFQNRYILNNVFARLQSSSLDVYSNINVPVNDGGIALGQLYFTVCGHEFIG